MESVRLDEFRAVAEKRQRIAMRIKQLQPTVSNRQIGRTQGVGKDTVNRDLNGANAPGSQKNTSDINGASSESGENSPQPMTGRQAAQLALAGQERENRRAIAMASNEKLAAAEVIPPRKTFETIVLDPPWPMTKIERDCRPNQPPSH
jgi:hypothetical protein